jgi:hypothetical protein
MPRKQSISAVLLVVVTLIAVGCAGGTAEPTEVAPPEILEVETGGEAPAAQQPPPPPPGDTQPAQPTATEEPQPQEPAEPQAPPAAQPAGSCTDDSAFVADVTVPDGTEFVPGESFKKTWQLSNSGTCTWTTGYQLYFFGGDQMGAPTAVGVSQNVPPGGTLDISLNMIAPDSAGEYTGYWKLINSSDSFFGTTSYVEILVTGAEVEPDTEAGAETETEGGSDACVDDAEFVEDVTVPDGTEFTSGQSFTKTWRLRNNGTCTWNTGYQLTFKTGEQMDAPAVVSVTASVSPGETLDISVDMSAPATPGEYTGTWRLANVEGEAFGTHPYVNIIVK